MKERIMSVLKRALWRLEKLLEGSSLVGNPVFFETDLFPWVARLEASWRVIREELDEVLRYRDELPNFQDISPDQRRITHDDLWKTFFFRAYGLKARGNCRRCPKTTEILKEVPGLKTAFFSILGPHKHIPPHRGPYKGVIRYHLGLLVPEPAESCRIRVADRMATWREGKSLIFDDTFEHEVWNDTDGVRVILFVDFVRPLRFPASVLNWVLLKLIAVSPYVLGAAGNYFAWERRFEKIVNARAGSAS